MIKLKYIREMKSKVSTGCDQSMQFQTKLYLCVQEAGTFTGVT